MPRFIGVWLMINCFGYVALSGIALFFPNYYQAAFRYLQPVLFGELVVMLWLLIKGAKVESSPQLAVATA
jgi:cytochrome b subunit of formate dehydrogenase